MGCFRAQIDKVGLARLVALGLVAFALQPGTLPAEPSAIVPRLAHAEAAQRELVARVDAKSSRLRFALDPASGRASMETRVLLQGAAAGQRVPTRVLVTLVRDRAVQAQYTFVMSFLH